MSAAECFRPYDEAYLADPYPVFELARREQPVFYSPDIDHWVVSRYDTVRSVLMDSARFSNANITRPVRPWPPAAAELMAAANLPTRPTMNATDGEQHQRVRQFLRHAFTPRRLEWIRPHVRRLATEHIDRFVDRGRCDLVKEMLYDIPAKVLFTFLGVPDADVAQVKAWSEARGLLTWGRPSEAELLDAVPLYVEYFRYCVDRVEELERNPGEDYISELVTQCARGDHPPGVDKSDVVMILFTILMAGHETTSNVAANGVRALLQRRDQWYELCAHPELVPNAVEEILRFDTSVISWRRITTTEVELDGVTVPENAQVLVLLGSANRDDEHFADADELDVRRPQARQHLSFTAGPHYCLGAPLARLELVIFLEELTARLPSLRIVPGQPMRFPVNLAHRGPHSLIVEWDS